MIILILFKTNISYNIYNNTESYLRIFKPAIAASEFIEACRPRPPDKPQYEPKLKYCQSLLHQFILFRRNKTLY